MMGWIRRESRPGNPGTPAAPGVPRVIVVGPGPPPSHLPTRVSMGHPSDGVGVTSTPDPLSFPNEWSRPRFVKTT